MRTNLICRFGLIVALICPVMLLISFGLWSQMPGCTAGDSGPASGCYLLGINFNWLINLGVLAFVGAFFLIPAGVIIVILGAFMPGKKKDKSS